MTMPDAIRCILISGIQIIKFGLNRVTERIQIIDRHGSCLSAHRVHTDTCYQLITNLFPINLAHLFTPASSYYRSVVRSNIPIFGS